MLAYTYPLLNLFWTMFVFFGFVVWIWLLVVVFGDIFRSHDMGGFAKALWVLLVVVLPLLGVLIYLIAVVEKCRKGPPRMRGNNSRSLTLMSRRLRARKPTRRTS